jgi:hypothetical protein
MTRTVYSPSAGKYVEVEELDTAVQPSKRQRREKATFGMTWAMVPHKRGIELAKRIGNPALAVLLVLEHLIHGEKCNRVKVTNDLPKKFGISHQSKNRGLRQLAAGGVVTIEWRGKEAPIATHLWYDDDGKLIRQP